MTKNISEKETAKKFLGKVRKSFPGYCWIKKTFPCHFTDVFHETEISLIRLIKIFATVLMLWRADLIHWGFLDAF
jgi:hypothetical protein